MSPRLGQWSGPDPPARPQRAALAASETDTTAPTGTGLSASGSQLVSGNKIGRYRGICGKVDVYVQESSESYPLEVDNSVS